MPISKIEKGPSGPISTFHRPRKDRILFEVRNGSMKDLPIILEWLKAEAEQDPLGRGFYCNRRVIQKCFEAGEGMCAVEDQKIIGFAIFQMLEEGCFLHIVEAHPTHRRNSVGTMLLKGVVDEARRKGAQYVEVTCTTSEGEALSRKNGFEDYVDPVNRRRRDADPVLRLYLSDWRPAERDPWA